jgi:hypothetical protein
MADSGIRRPASSAQEQSLGALVSQAIADVTSLLRFELDLAKTELKSDVRRAAIAAALLAMAGFVGALVLVLLCFAFAYGLMTLGIWGWASFLIVAGTCVLLAGLAVLIGTLRFRGITGLRKTRGTVSESISMLRHGGGGGGAGPSITGPAAG